MAVRERLRSPTRVTEGLLRDVSADMDDDRPFEEMDVTMDENATSANRFMPEVSRIPNWLFGMRPRAWKSLTENNEKYGRNVCFFEPLGVCGRGNIICGFCQFHLLAVFNLTYMENVHYAIHTKTGRPTLFRRRDCFVVEPQPIDDRVTAVFPILDFFAEKPALADLKLFHLSKFLSTEQSSNWQRVYSAHVNFLYRVATLNSPKNTPISDDDDYAGELNAKLLIHWQMWNDYNSWHLAKRPANLELFYSLDGRNVQNIPVSQTCTLTQTVCRLFEIPYNSLNEDKFFSTVSNYTFAIRNHFTYSNNLCSSGTREYKGLLALGNMATLPMVRIDTNKHCIRWSCTQHGGSDEATCLRTKIGIHDPHLNVHVVLPNISAANENINVV